jgi:hypothetical protein
MQFKKLTTIPVIAAMLIISAGIALAGISTDYPFDNAANYVVSNSDLIDISGGTADSQLVDEFQFNDTTAGFQTPESSVLLSDGNIFVTYTSGGDIYAKVINQDGETIVAETIVNEVTNATQFEAESAVIDTDAGDDIILVSWTSFDTATDVSLAGDAQDVTGNHIAARGLRYDGSTLVEEITEFQVNEQTLSTQNWPTIAAYNDGIDDKFAVFWYSNDPTLEIGGGSSYIAARTFDVDGANESAEFLVNDSAGTSQQFSYAKTIASGDIAVVYQNDTNLSLKILDNTDISGAPTLVETQVSATATNSEAVPVLEQTHDGNLFIVWVTDDDGDFVGVVRSVYQTNGTQVAAEAVVNTETDNFQESPSIALMPDPSNPGEDLVFIAYYTESTAYNAGADSEIVGKVYFADGSASSSENLINQNLTDFQLTPEVSATNDGVVLVLWESDDIAAVADADGTYAAARPMGNEVDAVYPTTFPYVQPATAYTNTEPFRTFDETELLFESQGTKFQVSNDDGVTWYYYDGADWTATTSTKSDFNTGFEVSLNLLTFDAGDFLWRAYIDSSDGVRFGNAGTSIDNIEIVENEAPVITSEGGAASVSKTLNEGEQLVSIVEFNDPDLDSTSTSLSGPDAALFSLSFNISAELELAFLSATPAADANADGVYEVTVSAIDDPYNSSDEQSFSIDFAASGGGGGGSSSSGSASSPADVSSPFNPSNPSTPSPDTCDKEELLEDIEKFKGFEREVSRYEAVRYVLLINCLGLDELPALEDYPFSDITYQNEELARVLYTAYNRGIVYGYDDGLFRPSRTINTIELLAINARAQGLADDNEDDQEKWFSNYLSLRLTIDLFFNNVNYEEPVMGSTFYKVTKSFLEN